MTMLLGAAKMLKKREGELRGSVRLLFQPAEEGGAGGKLMVQEGNTTSAMFLRTDTELHLCKPQPAELLLRSLHNAQFHALVTTTGKLMVEEGKSRRHLASKLVACSFKGWL